MAEIRTSDIRRNVGRTMLWPVRITLPLTEEMKDRLDAVRVGEESRVDVIRVAIERELARRERKQGRE